MASTLIVYATREGQTEKVARRIADVFRSRGSAVDLVDADHLPALDPSRFDLIIVGSPVRAQGYLRSVVRFVRKHHVTLERVPSAFFSVGLAVVSKASDGRAQTREVVERFIRKTGWRPQRVELVAGALPYSKYNFLIRFVMRRIASKEGGDTDTSRDYEYTDWRAVDAFASDLALGAVRDAAPSQTPAVAQPRPREDSPPMVRI
jgi:menaquinone-dependent protoporphyrinogen oxidase